MSRLTHLIVGAGQAGVQAAMAMREAGFAGRILLVGDERHRPYERPPLSKEALTSEPEPPPTYFHGADRLADRGVELILSARVVAIDMRTQRAKLDDGRALPFDRLLLATGGRPRRLSEPGDDAVLYLRTLDDARRIRERLVRGARVVCIGAGVIGLEIASSAHARGCKVTVLEAGPSVMGRTLPPELASYVEGLHRKAGVDIRLGCAVTAVDHLSVLADGAPIRADCVIAGIGIERNAEMAAEAGVLCEAGILVDELNRTSAEHVFAAGDATAFWHAGLQRRLRLEAWRHAQNHGIAAGRAMSGRPEPYRDVPWFWSDQHGANLQVAGLPGRGTASIQRGDASTSSFATFQMDANGAVVGAVGINAPREVRAAMSLIDAGVPVRPERLADPAVNLQRLVAEAKAASR